MTRQENRLQKLDDEKATDVIDLPLLLNSTSLRRNQDAHKRPEIAVPTDYDWKRIEIDDLTDGLA